MPVDTIAKYKPSMRVRMCLTAHWQNKLLDYLHQHFGISESFQEDHVIYVREQQFVKFLFAMQANGVSCSLAQLKAEYIDFRKEPHVTVVRMLGEHNGDYSPINGKDD
jgi:hypothetical protein